MGGDLEGEFENDPQVQEQKAAVGAGFRASYLGRSVPRVEDAPLLTGRARFVDDVDREGQVWARIVRSHVAHGRILSVNASAILSQEDVLTVVTAADLPDVRIPIRMLPSDEAARVLQPPLARDFVRYVGEPVAVVVATDQYLAEDAAEGVLVEIEEREVILDPIKATEPDAPALHEQTTPGNVIQVIRATHGSETKALFATADVVVRERLHVHRHSAIPLETRGLVAEYEPETGRTTVWGPAKVKHFNLRVLAQMLDLPEQKIRFIEPEVGGGFGVRGEFYPEDFLIPWLAIRLGRPVKWVEDRAEHFVATNHAREQDCEIEMAASSEGKLLAFRARCLVNQGAYARTHGGILLSHIVVTHIGGPYTWEGYEVECAGVLTNKTPAGTYRGPSQYEATFFRERMIDRVAHELGMDPAKLRQRNLVPLELMPYKVNLGPQEDPIVYDCGNFPLTLERLLRHSSYEELKREVESRRARGELTGIGVSAFVEAGGFGPYENARVVPLKDGSFVVHVGVASLGQGVRTALAQVAAEELGVPIEYLKISHQDTDVVPEGLGAYASRTTVLGGNAVLAAIRNLREGAVCAGAKMLGIPAQEVEVTSDGIVRPRGDRSRAFTLAQLECQGESRYEKPVPSFAMGCNLALVSVDPETGMVSLERFVICHDVGRIINPQIVEGQMVGAAAQGLSGALLEELFYDDRGQPLSTSFMDYLLPTAVEVPQIEAVVLELPQHSAASANPLGVKGCAESGIIGAAGAVANAVADALDGAGVSVRSLPLTPGAVRELLAAR